MSDTDDRIDRFIEIAKARITDGRDNNKQYLWRSLYTQLKDALPEDDGNELERRWNEVQRQIKLAQWDENFLKAIINEKAVYKEMVTTVNLYDYEAYAQSHQFAVETQKREAQRQLMQNAVGKSTVLSTGTGVGAVGSTLINGGFLK